MVIIRNKFIPFKGFSVINLFGILFVKGSAKVTEDMLRHEYIHTLQMKEMLYIFFYLWYVIEATIKCFNNGKKGYYRISFEQEAYLNEDNCNYTNERKHFEWFKYVSKVQYVKGI